MRSLSLPLGIDATGEEGLSQGLKPVLGLGLSVRTEVRTYLRGNGKGSQEQRRRRGQRMKRWSSMGRAFSALNSRGFLTQGDALGCDGAAPLGLDPVRLFSVFGGWPRPPVLHRSGCTPLSPLSLGHPPTDLSAYDGSFVRSLNRRAFIKA